MHSQYEPLTGSLEASWAGWTLYIFEDFGIEFTFFNFGQFRNVRSVLSLCRVMKRESLKISAKKFKFIFQISLFAKMPNKLTNC